LFGCFQYCNRLLTDILREINSDKIVGYVCIKINGTKKQLET
jgi:hypothetical protein